MVDDIAAGLASFASKLRCPNCHSTQLALSDASIGCPNCGASYPLSSGRPIMFRPDNTVFRSDDYLRPTSVKRRSRLQALIPDLSVNLSATRVLEAMGTALPAGSSVLVVGGGRQRAWLDPLLGVPRIQVVYSDVDTRADVDLFCDGHDLPFKDASFDAVVTTAVLEHVLYPEVVAGEIARVVRVGGLLYSELPFMQQVHEGAYDFTRYTLSGHRRLLNSFKPIESGMVAGPASALAWAIENFLISFFRSGRLRQIVKAGSRIGLFWLKHIDRLLKDSPQAMDGACCTFFYGRRTETKVSDEAVIEAYVGAKPLSHS